MRQISNEREAVFESHLRSTYECVLLSSTLPSNSRNCAGWKFGCRGYFPFPLRLTLPCLIDCSARSEFTGTRGAIISPRSPQIKNMARTFRNSWLSCLAVSWPFRPGRGIAPMSRARRAHHSASEAGPSIVGCWLAWKGRFSCTPPPMWRRRLAPGKRGQVFSPVNFLIEAM